MDLPLFWIEFVKAGRGLQTCQSRRGGLGSIWKILSTVEKWLQIEWQDYSVWPILKRVDSKTLDTRDEFELEFSSLSQAKQSWGTSSFDPKPSWQILGLKEHIFWEGHKILQDLHLTFVLCTASQK